jgi:hypothetical protein
VMQIRVDDNSLLLLNTVHLYLQVNSSICPLNIIPQLRKILNLQPKYRRVPKF